MKRDPLTLKALKDELEKKRGGNNKNVPELMDPQSISTQDTDTC